MAANAKVGVTIDANSAGAVKGLKNVENALKGVNKQTRSSNTLTGGIMRVQKAWSQVASTYTAVAAGAVAVGAAIWQSIKAYNESEKIQVRLEQSVKNATGSYAKWDATIQKTISSQSRLAAVDDELVSESMSKLVQMTGDVNTAMRLNALALDVSAGTGKDLISTATVIGKVYNGNVGALKRYGIVVKSGATATEALGEMQKKYAGQAEAYGESSAGAADRMSISWGNLVEAAGRFSVEVLHVDESLNIASLKMQRMADGEMKSWASSMLDVIQYANLFTGALGFLADKFDIFGDKAAVAEQDNQRLSVGANVTANAYAALAAAIGSVSDATAESQDAELASLRADQAVIQARKNKKHAIDTYGASSDEARIATLELKAAEREAATAASKFAGAQARASAASEAAKKTAEEYAKKLALIKRRANEAGDALDAMYGNGAGDATRAAGVYGGRRAVGSIERARPGGVAVTVAEGGSDEAIIPINSTNRARALLAETARRMGAVGGNTTFHISGSRYDADFVRIAVKQALTEALA